MQGENEQFYSLQELISIPIYIYISGDWEIFWNSVLQDVSFILQEAHTEVSTRVLVLEHPQTAKTRHLSEGTTKTC